MKYYPPNNGDYESGLTSGLLYSIVEGQIKRHITKGDIYHWSQLGIEKLWMKPDIRRELETFVTSFLFTGLTYPFADISQIAGADYGTASGRIHEITELLKQNSDNLQESQQQIIEFMNSVLRRSNQLVAETHRLYGDKTKKPILIRNTTDAFGHLTVVGSEAYLSFQCLTLP
ncbi:hypothetical protein HYT54_05415 [Candidatus Woesearchaeota archaeon]|nr:hypothetical protein [Candidatus Woesearchaeota archaeon]